MLNLAKNFFLLNNGVLPGTIKLTPHERDEYLSMRFKPAERDGKPVGTLVSISITHD
jgi:hypothetical protein